MLDNLDRQEADQSITLTAWPRLLPGLAFGEHTNYQRGEAVRIYFGNILCKHWREMNVSLSHGLTHPQNQDNIFYSPWLEKKFFIVFRSYCFRDLFHISTAKPLTSFYESLYEFKKIGSGEIDATSLDVSVDI